MLRRRLGVALLPCCVVVFALLDVAQLGPYTTWFNERLLARATNAGLVGQPEGTVEVVLGRASREVSSPAVEDWRSAVGSAPGRTFEYDPIPGLPWSKVQVHCRNGLVTSVELFDD